MPIGGIVSEPPRPGGGTARIAPALLILDEGGVLLLLAGKVPLLPDEGGYC